MKFPPAIRHQPPFIRIFRVNLIANYFKILFITILTASTCPIRLTDLVIFQFCPQDPFIVSLARSFFQSFLSAQTSS